MARTLEPITGEPVRSLQTFLRKISYSRDIPTVVPDGIFGSQTKNSVEGFQKLYGLPVTGEADFDTWNKIIEIFDEVTEEEKPPQRLLIFPEEAYIIDIGTEDEYLYVIQGAMKVISNNVENVPSLDITGVHDNQSVEATKSIQKIAGIDESGIIDKKTVNAITDVYEFYVVKKYTPGQEDKDRPGAENRKDEKEDPTNVSDV
ncbi:MAG: peptidoglycan-binding protein [Clostridia bacterium]|nr:peptidoglycan-binding protein [Clostridia bacterium]